MGVLAENDAIASVMMWEAMDAVNDGIVIVDKTSRILYVNKAYTKILAVSKDKVLHKQVKTIEPGALILQVLQNKEPVLQQLVEVKTRGKKIRVNITPIMKDGTLLGAVSVFNDITCLGARKSWKRHNDSINRSLKRLQTARFMLNFLISLDRILTFCDACGWLN